MNALPDRPRKGRGAVSNPDGRYETLARHRVDDGWGMGEGEEPEPVQTTVIDEVCRTIITRNDSPDVPFEQSINPYRGCEHGCAYCFARPSHARMGLSPGLDFETRLFAKPGAASLLTDELRKPSYQCSPIVLGANTDPYQPIERQRQITRSILEVLAAHDHPVVITTKSAMVVRDIDILAPMAAKRLVSVNLSITTLDRHLARTLEPRAATPTKRLETLAKLSAVGVPTAVLASPMIPALTDSELEAILEAAAGVGARSAAYLMLRLPLELKALFTEWLETHVPDRAERVLNRVRECREGALYVADFATRGRGTGTHADLLESRFRLACRRYGLNERTGLELDTTRFHVPTRPGDQLSLW
jgi:DNA repair photolyase